MAGIELYAPREVRHRRTWTWAIILLGFLMTTVSQIIGFLPFIIEKAVAIATNPSLAGQPVEPPSISITILIMTTAPAILMILAWVWMFERRRPAAIGFNGQALMRLGRGFLVGCAFLVVVVSGLWVFGVYQIEKPGAFLAPSLGAFATILGYAIAFLIQGSSEETAMRGWLMGTVASRHGVVWAVAINSVIFGAMHLLNIEPSPAMFAGCANVALFGVFISLYALKEQSLWGVCGWHGAWNWLLGVGFGLEVSGLKLDAPPLVVDLMEAPGAPWWLSGGSWGPEASILTTMVLGAGIAWLIWKGALKPQGHAVEAAKPVEEAF